MQDVQDLYVGSCELYVDDVNVGWTRGGVRMRVNKSFWGRSSFSGLGVDEIVKQSEDYYISTILVETTMLNLRQAWGINEEAIGFRVDFGGSGTISIHSLKFVGSNGFFEGYFYKVVAVDFGEIIFSPKSDAFIPVTFRAILDTTKAVGAQIGYLIRRILTQSNLQMRVDVPKFKTSTIWSRITIYRTSSMDFVSRLTVVYASGVSNIVSQIVVRQNSLRNLVTRVAVVGVASTYVGGIVTVLKKVDLNLVSRVTVLKKADLNLVSRVTVLKKADLNLVSRVTVTL